MFFFVLNLSAILQGLNPSKNREVPRLRHDFAIRLSNDFPNLRVTINGGISSINDAVRLRQIGPNLDGAMAGRLILRRPFDLLLLEMISDSKVAVDRASQIQARLKAINAYSAYATEELAFSGKDEMSSILLPFAERDYTKELSDALCKRFCFLNL